MSFPDFAPVLHVLGYLAACSIYGMLLLMVGRAGWSDATRLPFAAGALGIIWNLRGLLTELSVLGFPPLPEVVDAFSYSALAFLPAVVVHAILRGQPATTAKLFVGIAYAASVIASAGHFWNIVRSGFAPWPLAAHGLGPAFGVLIVPLVLMTGGQSTWKRALWMLALAVFALTGQEIAYHSESSLFVDLVGHHASMPLAFVILYYEYRFALADRFLKRALTIIALVSIAMGSFALLVPAFGSDLSNPLLLGAVLGLWILTGLLAPALTQMISRFVDRWFLGRDGYGELRADLARRIDAAETSTEVLQAVTDELGRKLGGTMSWSVLDQDARAKLSAEAGEETVWISPGGASATMLAATAEEPRYAWTLDALAEGRRLDAEDEALLEWASLRAARRIDRVRMIHERYEHEIRQKEVRKLATEAELRALRAQINPHFLFNALTTIGHLIRAAPERALETLMNLTELLRRVLRSTEETTLLGDELDLVVAYLDIERARFEERLRVQMDVADELRSLRVPPLILQPLVENAIKHGIAPLRDGGFIRVSGALVDGMLRLAVEDGGARTGDAAGPAISGEGVGLRNVRERLSGYYGRSASVSLRSVPGSGAIVELRFPATGPGKPVKARVSVV